MPSSEIKKEARSALSTKWGKSICLILILLAFEFIFSSIQNMFNEKSILFKLLNLAYFIISVPLSFGLVISFIKLKRNDTVSIFDIFKEGFSRFTKAWGIWFHTFIRIFLPIACIILVLFLLIGLFLLNSTNGLTYFTHNYTKAIILVAVSIVLFIASIVYLYSRSLLYNLAFYISYDYPELSSKECVLKSASYMKGNRGNLFLLELSFIGWAILSCITLGIGFLWLLPYIQVSLVCFYEKVTKVNSKEIEGKVNIEE